MCKLFKARDKETQEWWAIKRFDKSWLVEIEAYHWEIKILKALDYPNIVKLIDFYCSNSSNQMYIVYEFLNGKTIFDWMAINMNEISYGDIWRVFREIVKGVECLHWNNICHRDLKLENIMFMSDLQEFELWIKLIDFGFSKFFIDPDSGVRQ